MLQHHKKLSLDLDRLLPAEGLHPDDEDVAASSAVQSWKLRGSAKARVKPLSSRDLESLERRLADPADTLVQQLGVNGRPAKVSLGSQGIEWTYTKTRGCLPLPLISESVPFQEMLSVQQLDPAYRGMMECMHIKVFRFLVLTFQRRPQERCVWSPRRIVFESPSEDVAKDWRNHIMAGIAAASAGRPSRLLVIMNPNSGARRAKMVYQRIVGPVFAAAGVKTAVRETEYAGHAQVMMERLSLEDIQGIDGIVAVGGDGIFHEVLNGLLRARATAAPDLVSQLAELRVAHIPAGSTDAVACTLHGTRSVFTAAMHIALGDRTELDVLRVDTGEGVTRFASCIAAYGFMGDVMATSESYRWLGPVRYDIVGAAKLLANNIYHAKVSYLPGERYPHSGHSVCNANCPVCRTASFVRKTGSPPSAPSLLSHPSSLSSSSPSRDLAPAVGQTPAAGGGAAGAGAAFPAAAAAATPAGAGGFAAFNVTAASGGFQSRGTAGELEVPMSQEILPQAAQQAGELAGEQMDGLEVSPRRRQRQFQHVQQQQRQQQEQQYQGAAEGLPALRGSPTHRDFLQPASSAHERHSNEWKVVEGDFVSIMLIICPCRSEKTRQGMARFGHLADGRLKLVLVRRCNALQYLQFLLSMSKTGVFPGQHDYVEVLDAVAVKVECSGKLSHWNLDGELLSTSVLSAEVHQGLLQVFSRGVES